MGDDVQMSPGKPMLIEKTNQVSHSRFILSVLATEGKQHFKDTKPHFKCHSHADVTADMTKSNFKKKKKEANPLKRRAVQRR